MLLHLSNTSKNLSPDLLACHEMLCEGSRTFYAASFMLPHGIREPASALYAFCRVADDAIDFSDDRPTALKALQERLDRAYAGDPLPLPADRAFAEVVERFAIPKVLPEALLEGFAWDAEGRRYEDLSGVYHYSTRVAATVGAMMAMLMGVRDARLAARACDLGVAMQLTNIARDVGEDARAGRIYLPLSWLREEGIDPDQWLAEPVFNESIRRVVKRLLQTADMLYKRSGAGIARLPLGCRPAMYAARYLYAEIGREVARNGYDSVSQRAIVSPQRKALRFLSVLAAVPGFEGRLSLPPLEETRYLVDAVAHAPIPKNPVGRIYKGLPRKSFDDKMGWTLELFSQLEKREKRLSPANKRMIS